MSLYKYLNAKRKVVDKELENCLPDKSEYPSVIHKAIHYSVFSGGKRIRPILTLAAAETVGGKTKDALKGACAVELIHTFSLIHDDLPGLDDADTRRGKKSLHKKYDEAIAILAGDALLNFAFELLSQGKKRKLQLKIISTLSRAVGTFGMIGGQVADILEEEKNLTLPKIQYIHTHKTGALIAASLKVGALSGGGTQKQVEKLNKFGEYLGFAFQIIDDALDNQGYALLFGPRAARREALGLCMRAKKELSYFGKKAEPLRQISDFVATRTA